MEQKVNDEVVQLSLFDEEDFEEDGKGNPEDVIENYDGENFTIKPLEHLDEEADEETLSEDEEVNFNEIS